MLTLNYTYRIYPDTTQQSLMRDWLENCKQVYNYSLRELKDWLVSRKCSVDRCSLEKEYVISADVPFPSYQRQQDALPKATRKDFHLKTAHSLCNQAQTIFAEDLNTVGLNRGMLRKDCIDASFGQFLSLLEWVCWKRGAYFLKVNPRGTSQTCPKCLATVSKPLSEREHLGPECGYRAHRDCAAAQMVLLREIELVPVDNGEWKPLSNGVLSGVMSLDKCRSKNAQL